MKKILFLACILLVLVLSACEDRDAQKPELTLSIVNNELYGDGQNCNLNYTDVLFTLEGTTDFIANVKILVEYDPSKGFFVGPGSNYIYTDSNGAATGIFQVYESTLGVIPITAKLERFPSVKKTKVILAYDLPQIESFSADCVSMPCNESTYLSIQLTDQAGNLAQQKIDFSTNLGFFEHDSVLTDANGYAENIFFGNQETGTAVISARLALCPDIVEYLMIILEER
jgi:hypothetical protein